jgi:hypothetical protein
MHDAYAMQCAGSDAQTIGASADGLRRRVECRRDTPVLGPLFLWDHYFEVLDILPAPEANYLSQNDARPARFRAGRFPTRFRVLV